MEITRNTHLKVAFFIWGLVGTGLLIAGGAFLFGNRSLSVLNGEMAVSWQAEIIGVAIALVIGFIKGRFVLTKVARKYIARILTLPESSPFYMTFSPKSWFMVLGMMLLGRLIRALGAPHLLVGSIYVAVGFALVLGCLTYIKTPQARQAHLT